MSAEGKQYKKDVAELITDAGYDFFPKPEYVRVEADWYRARRSGDLDNRMKVLWDALQGLVYDNDSQIVDLHARRFDDKKNPRIVVRVYRA